MAKRGQSVYVSKRVVGILHRSLKKKIEEGMKQYAEYMLKPRNAYTILREVLSRSPEEEFIPLIEPVYQSIVKPMSVQI